MPTTKLWTAAGERNTGPILEVLEGLLPPSGHILEVASGPGQHVAAFAAARPALTWHPSDPDPAARASIAAWTAESGLANLAAPLDLDVSDPTWATAAMRALPDGSERFGGLVAVNLLHVAPWAACEGLLAGAAELLVPSGFLLIYGPFTRDGRHNSEGNRAFDRSLRASDPALGLRDVNEVRDCAARNGLVLERLVEMPANNRVLIFRISASETD